MNEIKDLKSILERDGKLAYTCRGVSMRPLLRQGRDIVILQKKTAQRCRRLDTVLFLRRNGQYVLHRVLKVRDGAYWIVGDNCMSGENVQEEQILGVLTGIKRGKRTIRVTDTGYRIYSHLWGDLYLVRFAALRMKAFAYRILRPIKKKVFG